MDVVIRHVEKNADSAVKGAAVLAALKKAARAIRRFKDRHPNSDGELSTSEVSQPEEEPKRCLNYVLPSDLVELTLALEALPADIVRTSPPPEKWWRHGHGWITAEEGWRLDGYSPCERVLRQGPAAGGMASERAGSRRGATATFCSRTAAGSSAPTTPTRSGPATTWPSGSIAHKASDHSCPRGNPCDAALRPRETASTSTHRASRGGSLTGHRPRTGSKSLTLPLRSYLIS